MDYGGLLLHVIPMSSYLDKLATDTTQWVRGIVLRAENLIYYRQGVRNPGWYEATTEMLRRQGLPARYSVVWGEEPKKRLKEVLEGYP